MTAPCRLTPEELDLLAEWESRRNRVTALRQAAQDARTLDQIRALQRRAQALIAMIDAPVMTLFVPSFVVDLLRDLLAVIGDGQ